MSNAAKKAKEPAWWERFQAFWWEIASAGIERVEVVFPRFPALYPRVVYVTYRRWAE